MRNLALSDDETVALAMLAGRPWPALLPTVDPGDPDDLVRSGQRGLRSLAIRDLVTFPSGQSPRIGLDLAEVSSAVLGRPVQATTYAATEDLTWVPAGLTVTFFGQPADRSWVMQVISATGVSYFSDIARTDARELVADLVRATYDNGLQGPDVTSGARPHWYCVARGEKVLAVAEHAQKLLRWNDERSRFAVEPAAGTAVDIERSLWAA